MIIKSIHVRNFRCILDETLHCEPLTVLIGPNGCGKSSFLRALELFYQTDAEYTDADFYSSRTDEPIRITVTFGDLTDEERNLFASHLTGDLLPVEKELRSPRARDSQKYYGLALRNPDFSPVRQPQGAPQKRAAYAELRRSPDYAQLLPPATRLADMEDALRAFELANPDHCAPIREETQFFGYPRVGGGLLDRFTHFSLLPAVRDASEDATEGRGAAISQLMEVAVRSALAQREDLAQLRERADKEYDAIMASARVRELDGLERDLTATLDTYAPGATVGLHWSPEQGIDIRMPTADVGLVEDDYESSVARAGHGLQRTFILTLLEHLAAAEVATRQRAEPAAADEAHAKPPQLDLVLAIEEPELYQHPSRQRHLANVLLQLASGKLRGLADRMQIIYSTHSPLLVGIDRLDQLRLLRKRRARRGNPKQTRVTRTTLHQVAEDIRKAHRWKPGAYTADALGGRLRAVMTPWMNEGFFADVLVLVEGEDDRAAIVAVASINGHDFEAMGISVIPCMSADNLDKAAGIFKRLGLPLYLVWDNDRGNPHAKRRNRSLLRLCRLPEEDYPHVIGPQFACLDGKLEQVLRSEIGDALFDRLVTKWRKEYCIPRRHQAVKKPYVLERVIHEAAERGRHPQSIHNIVATIVAFHRKTRRG